MTAVMRLGLIVNPIAGMGGAVGLKGSDGEETLARARELGAEPQSSRMALRALSSMPLPSEVVTGPGPLGAEVAREAGIEPRVIPMEVLGDRRDTLRLGRSLLGEGLDLLAFVGGDGTARDVLEAVSDRLPVIGVPAGVKMHSAVFLHRPEELGELLGALAAGEASIGAREVLDIDEGSYREGRIDVRLHGLARVPAALGLVQAGKQAIHGADEDEEAEEVAQYCLELMEPGTTYFIGPGGGTMALMRLMGLPGTLLGFDVVRDRRLLAADANAAGMESWLDGGGPCRAVLGVIGGQGFLLGRGNRQLTPRILDRLGRDGLLVLAPPHKTRGLEALRVDSGSAETDAMLRGHLKVLSLHGRLRLMRVR